MQRNRTNWNDSKELCESLGGHLAVITKQREQIVVVDRFNSTAERVTWLGGFHNGSTRIWSWTTGEQWNYTNFPADNISPIQDKCLAFGHVNNSPSREWLDRDCTALLYTLCELN